MKKLVIVESPTKAKTISRFLGKDYIVLSSYGHIRDLPKSKLGVDVEHGFTPEYVIPTDKKKQVTALKKALTKADGLILATDEDREGEAIAWHLTEALQPKEKTIERIAFHEITEDAIKEALAHPRTVDMKRVDAQQTRRILDRLVGYELSPLLWRKVARGLSAGRVQSVAVRIIVEREREILAFKTEEYWTIDAQFRGGPKGAELSFPAKLHALDGRALEKFSIITEDAAKKIVDDLSSGNYTVASLTKKLTKRSPSAPFTTSTLQQDANNKLGFSAKQTMMFAQQLYEGVELGNEGSQGLITYMRTDSVNLAEKFLAEVASFIKKNVGADYAPTAPRKFTTKSKLAQEAHEAIRPTSAFRTPESVRGSLEQNQWELYDLIWRRAIASQMTEAQLESTTVDIETTGTNKTPYLFRASGSVVIFDGFLKVLGTDVKTTLLPPLKEKDAVACETLEPKQHFTEPPARYSDASLVKALEEYDIGRPSTYAPTIATIIDRKYVDRIEGRKLKPTDIGMLVNDLLVEHFPQIVDYTFTATMENALDDIANGTKDWQPILATFYEPFKANLREKEETLTKKAITEEKTDEVCDKCGKPMVIKTGRFGRFLACTGFPECRNTKQLTKNAEGKEVIEAPITTDEKCAACGAPMTVKRGRFGPFLSCSKYPECKTIKSIEKKTGVKCPECKEGDIVAKRSKKGGRTFYACNKYPSCKFALWSKPTGATCPTCGSLIVYGAKETIRCSKKECGYISENLNPKS